MIRGALAFLGPLGAGAVVAAVGLALGLADRSLSAAVYVGELAVALVLVRLWIRGGVGLWSVSALGVGLLVGGARGAVWVTAVPVQPTALVDTVVVGLGYALLVSVAEEVHFRGLLQGLLTARFGAGRGLVVAAVLFGLPHLFLNGLLWMPLFVADGILFGALYLRTGTLGAPIAAHAIGNALTASIFIGPPTVDEQVAATFLILATSVDLAVSAVLLRARAALTSAAA